MLIRVARDIFVIVDVLFALELSLFGSGLVMGLHGSLTVFSLLLGVGVLALAFGMFVSAYAVARGLVWQGRLRTMLYCVLPIPYLYAVWFAASISAYSHRPEWLIGTGVVVICVANLVGYRVWLRHWRAGPPTRGPAVTVEGSG